MQDQQPWKLVCLRSAAAVPSSGALATVFGVVPVRVVSEVHPLDAEPLSDTFGGEVVVTLSKAVIDMFAPASAQEARRRLWFADAQGQLRGLTEDQAELFWRSWEAGVQHVSEILVTCGMWW